MSSKVRNILVFLNIQVPNDIIFFGRRMHNICFILCEMDQVHPVLLGVQGPFQGASLAIINDNLVVIRAGDQGGAVGAEVHVVDGVLVVPEHLADPHGPDDVVHQLHLVDDVLLLQILGT